jgi:hypothetical protein
MPASEHSFRARLKDPERRVELIATILMSVAVVCTAYCAWQATRWGGVQAVAFAEASTARVESSKALAKGTQEMAYDASTLLQLTTQAYNEGTPEAALDFADRFMRDEFKAYVDEWLAMEPFINDDAPATPFDLPDFANSELQRAESLEEDAAAKFDEAKSANQTGDDYILATVFFAVVLFFCGIAPKLDQRPLQWMVLVLAFAGLGTGLARALTLPFF